jgi:large subunit ribosomal protein L13
MRTFVAKPEKIQHSWFIVDANGQTLGRLATEVARRLRGKHKPEFTPHADAGDYVVVINASKIKVTGNKAKDKMYHRYSGYQSGLKSLSLEELLMTRPAQVIEIAVKGMLPKGPLGRQIYKKLKVYPGAEHPHASQQPQPLKLDE